MNLKHLCAAAAAFVVAATLPTQATAQATPAQQSAVLRHLKGGNEPTIKDAIFTSDRMLKVGVIDNKTQRDGFAQYVCQELTDKGLKGMRVQVVDIAALARTGKWVTLGEAGCR